MHNTSCTYLVLHGNRRHPCINWLIGVAAAAFVVVIMIPVSNCGWSIMLGTSTHYVEVSQRLVGEAVYTGEMESELRWIGEIDYNVKKAQLKRSEPSNVLYNLTKGIRRNTKR